MTHIKHKHTTKRRAKGVHCGKPGHNICSYVRGKCTMLPCFSRRTAAAFKPAKYADCSNNDDYVCAACMRGSNLLATAEGSRMHWQCQRHGTWPKGAGLKPAALPGAPRWGGKCSHNANDNDELQRHLRTCKWHCSCSCSYCCHLTTRLVDWLTDIQQMRKRNI